MFRAYAQSFHLRRRCRGWLRMNSETCSESLYSKSDTYVHRLGQKRRLNDNKHPHSSCPLFNLVANNRTRTIVSVSVLNIKFPHSHYRFLHSVREPGRERKQRVKKRFKQAEVDIENLISALKVHQTVELSDTVIYQDVLHVIEQIKLLSSDDFVLNEKLSTGFLAGLCRHSLFDSAYRLLCILDETGVALHVHYIILANAAAANDDITVAANVCNLAYKKDLCIDYATCSFLIHGLCDRSLIAFELSKMLQDEPLKSKVYRANEFEKICKKDTNLALAHLIQMIEQKEIMPDQLLFMEVIQVLLIQRDYHKAARVLSMMRRNHGSEGNRFEGENININNVEVGNVDSALEVEIFLDRSGANLKGDMEFYGKIAPDFYEKVSPELSDVCENLGIEKYIFNHEEEETLFKAWNHKSLKGWGPYFVLREWESAHSKSFSKRADNTLDVGDEELLAESTTADEGDDPDGRGYYIDTWRESYLEDCGTNIEELDDIIEKIENGSVF